MYASRRNDIISEKFEDICRDGEENVSKANLMLRYLGFRNIFEGKGVKTI